MVWFVSSLVQGIPSLGWCRRIGDWGVSRLAYSTGLACYSPLGRFCSICQILYFPLMVYLRHLKADHTWSWLHCCCSRYAHLRKYTGLITIYLSAPHQSILWQTPYLAFPNQRSWTCTDHHYFANFQTWQLRLFFPMQSLYWRLRFHLWHPSRCKHFIMQSHSSRDLIWKLSLGKHLHVHVRIYCPLLCKENCLFRFSSI